MNNFPFNSHQIPPAPAPAPAPALPGPSDSPLSSEAVNALMAEKRRVNNERRKQQSARNAAIEARLQVLSPIHNALEWQEGNFS